MRMAFRRSRAPNPVQPQPVLAESTLKAIERETGRRVKAGRGVSTAQVPRKPRQRGWRRPVAIAGLCLGLVVPAGSTGVAVVDASGQAHNIAIGVLESTGGADASTALTWCAVNAIKRKREDGDEQRNGEAE